jgi:hypothetical protein
VKWAWYILAWATLAAACVGGKLWLERPDYVVVSRDKSELSPWMKWDARSGRVWVYVISTKERKGAWVELE